MTEGTPIQLDFVQQALIHEEQKQKGNTQNSDTSVGRQDSALVGACNKSDRPHKPPVCWNCQEVGHIQQNCPKEKDSGFQYKAKTAEEKSPDSDGEGAFSVSHDLPEMGSGWWIRGPQVT